MSAGQAQKARDRAKKHLRFDKKDRKYVAAYRGCDHFVAETAVVDFQVNGWIHEFLHGQYYLLTASNILLCKSILLYCFLFTILL